MKTEFQMSILDSGVGIIGLGKYIPKNVVTNENLAGRLNVASEWILKGTGIKSRYFVNGEESASWISAKASKQALERAGVSVEDISLVIGCTFSGDYVFPAMACKVQDLLGAKQAGAFDLSAGSTGFQIAVSLASDRLRCDSTLQHILIVGTAVQSQFLDWNDPKVSILFGDGSGAAILSRVPKGYGALASEVFCDSKAFEAVRLKKCGTNGAERPYIEMDGMAVGREFLKHQPLVIDRALKKAGLGISNVDLFIFHQANLRLIQLLMERMKLPMTKTYTNVDRIGNTSDASLPIALCEASEEGLIKRDQIVVISGVGAGCTFGATVFKWY